jgi:hypothetical protein
MVKLSRYFLVITAVAAFAVVLPKLYWMAFARPVNTPFVMYSCIKNDFMIIRTGGEVKRTDTKGNIYTREEYEQNLPLFYTRQLLMSKTMPDSINGVEMDMHAINNSNSTFRLKPDDVDSPVPGLYPMFESQSGRASLEMPLDYFRVTWRMEFIDAKSNKILEEKSRMFSAVLYKNGFKFPAKSISGLPTTRKSCDEGYFIVDKEHQLFHVKMIKGEPYVKNIKLPAGLKFKNISCVDFRDKKYYAYLFSDDNQIYILTQDDYNLIRFPVDDVNVLKYTIQIFGNLFHYNIIVTGDNFMEVTVLDTEYKKVDAYSETWPSRIERSEGKVFGLLFPGQISLTSSKSNYVRFYTDVNSSFYWLGFSLLLMLIHFLIVRKRKAVLNNQIADFGIILVTGIFGFLAVNIFPNKFFR